MLNDWRMERAFQSAEAELDEDHERGLLTDEDYEEAMRALHREYRDAEHGNECNCDRGY